MSTEAAVDVAGLDTETCLVCGNERPWLEVCPVCSTSEETERCREYVAGLRALTDFIEAHPELTPQYPMKELVYGLPSEQFAAATRTLLGAGQPEKVYTDESIEVRVAFGPHFLGVYTSRSEVCERRQVGTKLVEKVDPDAPRITVEEPVYEWDCKPILGGL